jgi:hypothetical protein
MNKLNIDLPEKSIGYLIVCTAIALLFVVGSVSLYQYKNKIINDINALKFHSEEQKELAPIYLSMLKFLENKDSDSLPNPAKTKLPRQDSGKFQDTFQVIAIKSGMMIISLTPDLNTLTESSQHLLYNVVVKGEFANFRKMLVGLGGISYLDKIEEIKIQQYPDSMEFRMKIWIAIGSK